MGNFTTHINGLDWSSFIHKIRFALALCEPVGLHDALEIGSRAEEWGFDAVAVSECLFWYEPAFAPVWDNFTVLTTLANRTNNIGLMTAVIDPVKRHPAIIAHMVATLDQISPNRFLLGIGPGEIANFGPIIDLAGTPPYRLLTRTKEFINVLQGTWASTPETPFSFAGDFFHVEKAYLSLKPATKPHPPIYIGAMGSKMRQLTGEMANGWLPVTYTPETFANDWQMISKSAEKVGRNPAEIDRGLLIYTTVLDDGEKAKAHGSLFGRDLLIERPDILQQLGYATLADDRLSLVKKVSPSAGADLAQQIPQSLVEQVIISGTPQQAIQQIERFIQAGVRLFAIWLPFDDEKMLRETIRHYRDTILPYFCKLYSNPE